MLKFREVLLGILVAGMALLPACGSDKKGPVAPDTAAPSQVSDLAAAAATNAIVLSWTAPGDDGASGTASQYDLRYSDTGVITEANWGSAHQATGEPSPRVAGTSESFAVAGLNANTAYWFALKTADETANWSTLSNSPSGRIPQGISGTVTVQPGSPADPTNARAAVYSSLADFTNDAWVKQTAVQHSGTAWTFSLELNVGQYYVDVWKDVNNNGNIDAGDIYGFYTTGQGGAPAPVMVTQNAMTPISLLVQLNPAKGKLGR